MNYPETIEFLYSRLPVFHNIGARAFKPGLKTTLERCESLGNPQNDYPCIHIGGTNGKGSSSHMIAAILQTAGYKVGLYTSPHLKAFTERIKVNGQEADQGFIVEFTVDNLSNIDRFEPSFFELTVAMAFSYFAARDVDVAVIEVGMGGRLDSTNIISPILSLITNVSYDHTQFLGDTLEKIAYEKAGIIKEHTPVVVSEYQHEVANVFVERAASMNSKIVFGSRETEVAQKEYHDGKIKLSTQRLGDRALLPVDLELDLTGSYQLKNVCGVLAAVKILNDAGFNISELHVQDALANVVALTGLKGRWQKLNENPVVYCDTAHNSAGLSYTISQFNSISSSRKRFVIGFVGDKDINAMLGLFPKDADYYFTQPSNLRALRVDELKNLAGSYGLNGNSYEDVNAALHAAIAESKMTDSIYVGGSTFVVADLAEI